MACRGPWLVVRGPWALGLIASTGCVSRGPLLTGKPSRPVGLASSWVDHGPIGLGPWVVAFFHRIPAIEAKTLIYIALSHKTKIFGSFFGWRGLGPCSSQKFIRYFISEQSVLYKGR